MYRRHGKRILDVMAASMLLLLLAPVILLTALCVRLALGSPVLFRQKRPGLHGMPYRLLKFRTMKNLRDSEGKPLPDEQRLNSFGCFLRSTSLDELPELLNVIAGQMSLVGPRPLLMNYLKLYDSEQCRRHAVRPGITGWAQVNGRNVVSWPERFKLDVWYVDHLSPWLDVRILLKTVSRVLRRQGIHAAGDATMPEFRGNTCPNATSAPQPNRTTVEPKKSLYIYGASGHAKVVVDIAERSGGWRICGILDDHPTTETFLGYPVFSGRDHLLSLDPVNDSIAVAIGANSVRRALGAMLACRGFKLPVLIHPSAVIGRDVHFGAGTVIMAGAIINPATTVGALCILNTGCTVDHDNQLGQAVHVSPGAHLAGGVRVGDESWIGIGASVIQQRTVGSRCMVGAGAAVIGDVDDDDTVVGVPARPVAWRMPAMSPEIPRI